jgi:prepilin-type N-terminal cleavage/methylation domain-containing protein
MWLFKLMTGSRFSRRSAFTLIELLIVVAIIAILAAIAVPNFLEAQTRAKASRAKSDLRTLATGLESYFVDHNAYPQCNSVNNSGRRPTDPQTNVFWVLEHLSTPVAYLTSGVLPDPFKTQRRSGAIDSTTGNYTPASIGNDYEAESSFKYAALTGPGATAVTALVNTADAAKGGWATYSVGPDAIKTSLSPSGLLSPTATIAATCNNIYDTTNGTVSNGDIFRVGAVRPGLTEGGGAFVAAVSRAQ